MADNEIIKVLECCLESECEKCQYQYDTACKEYILHGCLSFINRQKAEIEALTMENKQLKSDLQLLKGDYEYVKDNLDEIVERDKQLILKLRLKLAKAYSEQKTIKSEAIKDFAEKVKLKFYEEFDELIPSIMADEIDNLVAEMVGDE